MVVDRGFQREDLEVRTGGILSIVLAIQILYL